MEQFVPKGTFKLGSLLCIFGAICLCICFSLSIIIGIPVMFTQQTVVVNNTANLTCKCLSDENCLHGGICWFGKCICNNGWFGDKCELNICPPVIEETCLNNSICGVGFCYYNKCICPVEYIGDHCEYKRMKFSYCHPEEDVCEGGLCLNNNCYCPLDKLNCFNDTSNPIYCNKKHNHHHHNFEI